MRERVRRDSDVKSFSHRQVCGGRSSVDSDMASRTSVLP